MKNVIRRFLENFAVVVVVVVLLKLGVMCIHVEKLLIFFLLIRHGNLKSKIFYR